MAYEDFYNLDGLNPLNIVCIEGCEDAGKTTFIDNFLTYTEPLTSIQYTRTKGFYKASIDDVKKHLGLELDCKKTSDVVVQSLNFFDMCPKQSFLHPIYEEPIKFTLENLRVFSEYIYSDNYFYKWQMTLYLNHISLPLLRTMIKVRNLCVHQLVKHPNTSLYVNDFIEGIIGSLIYFTRPLPAEHFINSMTKLLNYYLTDIVENIIPHHMKYLHESFPNSHHVMIIERFLPGFNYYEFNNLVHVTIHKEFFKSKGAQVYNRQNIDGKKAFQTLCNRVISPKPNIINNCHVIFKNKIDSFFNDEYLNSIKLFLELWQSLLRFPCKLITI